MREKQQKRKHYIAHLLYSIFTAKSTCKHKAFRSRILRERNTMLQVSCFVLFAFTRNINDTDTILKDP